MYGVAKIASPAETIGALSYECHVGGKGLNQSVALAYAGAEVYHAGAIGAEGAWLKDFMQQCGVNSDFVTTLGSASGHAIIQVDSQGQNSIIVFGGANRRITPQYCDSVLAHFGEGDMLLLQNEISCVEYLILSAHKKGLQIVFNPSPFTEDILKLPLEYVDWFLVNEIEGKLLAGETDDEIHAEQTISAITSGYPYAKVVLTLGGNGAAYFDGAQFAHQKAEKATVVDTTAAGDTFTGYFLASIAKGLAVGEAVGIAQKASAIAISRKGAAESIPKAHEL